MWTLFFMFLAGASNAVMDTIQFKFNESVFSKYPKLKQWANPKLSWRNKWKNKDPNEGERFPGSSTVFVWTTDLWHFAQSIMISSFVLAILTYDKLFCTHAILLDILFHFIIYKGVFSGAFELFWSKILRTGSKG